MKPTQLDLPYRPRAGDPPRGFVPYRIRYRTVGMGNSVQICPYCEHPRNHNDSWGYSFGPVSLMVKGFWSLYCNICHQIMIERPWEPGSRNGHYFWNPARDYSDIPKEIVEWAREHLKDQRIVVSRSSLTHGRKH